jgi:hypothetical protein
LSIWKILFEELIVKVSEACDSSPIDFYNSLVAKLDEKLKKDIFLVNEYIPNYLQTPQDTSTTSASYSQASKITKVGGIFLDFMQNLMKRVGSSVVYIFMLV